ncbi:MAG: hypothetical protein U9O82_04595, partial [Thermodesulfobacteriota bacterium]|nr:hypothetical protein [Thermodesulfobacteriota bacterium]
NVCAGTYTVSLQVTDAESASDLKDFTLTVANGTLFVSPAPGGGTDFNCTTPTFFQDFTVSGPALGSIDNWVLSWLVDPGGFGIEALGDNKVRFQKTDTSIGGTYSFKITGSDTSCPLNTFDSGYYSISISGEACSARRYRDEGD